MQVLQAVATTEILLHHLGLQDLLQHRHLRLMLHHPCQWVLLLRRLVRVVLLNLPPMGCAAPPTPMGRGPAPAPMGHGPPPTDMQHGQTSDTAGPADRSEQTSPTRYSDDGVGPRDPPRSTTKGRARSKRFHSALELHPKRKNRCSFCNSEQHNAANCPTKLL